MGYLNAVNNKGRTINTLVNNDGVKYVGPDFKTLVKRNGKPDIVLANRWAFFNITINQGKVATSDHLPIHNELSTRLYNQRNLKTISIIKKESEMG